jgi:hypothetical protein
VNATLPGVNQELSPSLGEARAYISDMLSQLADIARGAQERRLELAIRLLAVEAAGEGECRRRAP